MIIEGIPLFLLILVILVILVSTHAEHEVVSEEEKLIINASVKPGDIILIRTKNDIEIYEKRK